MSGWTSLVILVYPKWEASLKISWNKTTVEQHNMAHNNYPIYIAAIIGWRSIIVGKDE